MTPEEFAEAVKRGWTGLCDHAYAVATVLAVWLIALGHLALKLLHLAYIVGDTVLRRGWRVILPWNFLYLSFGLSYRIVHGLPMPDTPAVLGAIGTLVVPVIVALITRSLDYRNGCANPPSTILATITSIFQTFNPNITPDGAPRMVVPA